MLMFAANNTDLYTLHVLLLSLFGLLFAYKKQTKQCWSCYMPSQRELIHSVIKKQNKNLISYLLFWRRKKKKRNLHSCKKQKALILVCFCSTRTAVGVLQMHKTGVFSIRNSELSKIQFLQLHSAPHPPPPPGWFNLIFHCSLQFQRRKNDAMWTVNKTCNLMNLCFSLVYGLLGKKFQGSVKLCCSVLESVNDGWILLLAAFVLHTLSAFTWPTEQG